MESLNINDFNSHRIDETDIIRRILGGEKELYEILVRRYNQQLYRVIRSYLKDEAEVEDIMQDCYIKAYTKLHQFNLESKFSTWLIRIGINDSLAKIKKRGKVLYLNSNNQNAVNNLTLEIPDHKQLNPQEKMVQKESKQLFENAIDQLDSKYKAVYMLKEVEEMSLKEISITLGLTVSNVKIRLHRSKEMLKQKLYEISNDKNVFEFGFKRCDRITENVMKRI